MRKIVEILRLGHLGLSVRQIARSLNIPRSTVGDCLDRAKVAGLSWPLPEGMGEEELEARLYAGNPAGEERPVPDWKGIQRELKCKGVTLKLLWMEYRADNPDGYQYSHFCNLYRDWRRTLDPVMRQVYKAGEKMFVDFAGPTMPIIDRFTGEVSQALVFVAALGASNYIFAKPVLSANLEAWINCHVAALDFFGGVPEIIVPDNPRTAVSRASWYEPELNPTYQEMAVHYGTAILPARPRKPRDKAKVETAVQVVEREVMAPLRNRRFFSLEELEAAILERLLALNNRPFQKLDGSRFSLYETVEKPALRPLPPRPYEFAQWKKAKANIDYHVEIDHNFYSVPYRLTGQEVNVRLSGGTVEIFHAGDRVASHARAYGKGQYITETSHRPAAHQKHLEWTPSRLIDWASTVGEDVAKLVKAILEHKPHPEQGYRACLGIMRLAKHYPDERLQAACRRALAYDLFSYRSVKHILEKGLDSAPLPAPEGPRPVEHANIRGPAYFTQVLGGDGPC